MLARLWDGAVIAHLEPEEVGTIGSVLCRGASERELVALEARIGRSLPPSYRAFLAFSNGAWSKPGWNAPLIPDENHPEAGLLTADQVGWLVDLDPRFVEIWMAAGWDEADDLSDEVYFDYSRQDQDPCEIRVRDMPHLLMVSCFDWESAVFLNPTAVSSDGEWEAWDFANSNPGAFRYRSFAELLRAQPGIMAREDAQSAEIEAQRTGKDAHAVDAAFVALESETDAANPDHLETLNCLVDPDPWFDRLVGLLSSPQVSVVQAALRGIARVETSEALEVILAIVERDPSAPITSVVMPRLVSDPDPQATQAALRLLQTQPDAAFSVPWTDDGKDLIWQAWENTGRPFCLKAAAERHDRRAVDPLCALLPDASLTTGERGDLAQAATNLPDPRLIPAILAAVRLGGPHLGSAVDFLIRLGALDEAESLITPQALADPLVFRSRLEQAQREITRRRNGHRPIGTPIPTPPQP